MPPKLRIAKKHVENVDSATPVAKESHVERMVRSSLQKAADSLPEMDRILVQLPKAVKDFMAVYGQSDGKDLLAEEPDWGPAKNLRQVVWHFRDLSWRTSLHQDQAEKLCEIFAEPLQVMQVLVSSVGGLDLQACLDKGASSANVLGAYLLGLEISTLYCVLASSFGVPVTLVVEEVSFGIVKCLKEVLRQVITPMLSSDGERGKKGSKNDDAGDLPFSAEENALLCTAVSDLMQALHEFLSRHKLGEDQLHQLIHMSLSVFFFAEPNFRLCSAAEEMLVTIFSRNSALRGSVIQEFLSRAPRLPCGKRAKKFQLPATEDNAAYGLSTWTHLLLRLCQSSCLPLREPIGAHVDFEAVVQQKPGLQTVIAQLMAGLLQRLVLSRSKDEEARGILEDFAEELLNAAFKPMWPAAVSLLRYLLQQLIALLQEKKQAGDITVREFALKLLSRAEVRLWHHAVQTAQDVYHLPPWTQAPDDVPKDKRLLQHIALRVSLEDGRDLPWTHAARAVEAWDAELFLAKGATDSQTQGLRSFSDDIVFLHLTMAFLADECLVPLLLPPTTVMDSGGSTPIASAPASPLSACVFDASHPVHAWSFLVCDLAEAQEVEAHKKKAAGGTPLQRFLASAWCSPTLVCDTASWRGAGGRRVLLPYTVYKVYRQLRSSELDLLRRAALDCIIMQANSPQASLRKTAMRALSELVDMDISVLTLRPVEETVDMRLRDESSWVRQVTLDLLGRILEGSLSTEANSGEVTPRLLSMESSEATAKAMLLRFHKTVRGRVNDTAVIVRRQATKILSAFVLNHPDHPDVIPVTLDLLRRSTDSEALRNLVMGTFELLWFMDDEPTPEAAKQLSRVVDASRSMAAAVGDILLELLRRFRKTIGSRKNSKGYEFAIRRWTTLILNEFVQLKCQEGKPAAQPPKKRKGMKQEPVPLESPEEQWLLRRSLLSTLEAFAAAQPKDLLVHLRPLTIYLALEDTSTPEEQWVAIKVCRILSSVLPYVAERRGLMDHRQVQADLQALIRSQPSSGVHEAVRCLCLVVKYVTGDLAQIVTHLNVAVPSLTKLCGISEQKGTLERIQIMYMSRQAWVLASILESLSVDDYVQLEGVKSSEQPKRRLLPRSELKFDLVSDSVAGTVADLLLRLNEIGEPQLRAVAASCMGFFLKGQRTFTKDRRISDLLSSALSSGDLLLCRKALETLSALLSYFRSEAERESKATATDFADSRDGRVAGQTGNGSGTAGASGRQHNSAIEAAQPLAAFSDQVLAHITLAGSVGPRMKKSRKRNERSEREEEENGSEGVLRVRVEALSVVRHLHQQGLVNPMVVLPKVFALAFTSDMRLSEPATSMLKEMLELRPNLLLNRLDEAFREAFLALLSGTVHLGEALSSQQLAGLGDVYAERFRKQKALRDGFLRKALQQLQRLPSGQFEDRFAELAALGVLDDDSEPSSSRKEKPFAQLPLRQRQQLLYSQFIASAISALPFIFENEPLLLIFECNHHISLHAGTLLASFEGESTPKDPPSPEQVFVDALSVVSCVVLKGVMKRDYNLSPEQCATFNPRDIRQERIGRSMAMFNRDKEEGQTGSVVRNRFPAAEWLEKVLPLVERFSQPAEIAAYIRELTDADPWDDSRTRHEHKIDALEGRRGRRVALPKASPRGRGRGQAKKQEKKKGRRRGYASEEDSDYEGPNRKRPRARREAAQNDAADEESEDMLPQDVD